MERRVPLYGVSPALRSLFGSGWSVRAPLIRRVQVQGDARRCSNCEHHEECWSHSAPRPLEREDMGYFSFRPGWDEARFEEHLKGITGQVCDSFVGVGAMREHFQNADRKKRERLGLPDNWDASQNP